MKNGLIPVVVFLVAMSVLGVHMYKNYESKPQPKKIIKKMDPRMKDLDTFIQREKADDNYKVPKDKIPKKGDYPKTHACKGCENCKSKK